MTENMASYLLGQIATRIQFRIDAMNERDMDGIGISKGLARDIVLACESGRAEVERMREVLQALVAHWDTFTSPSRDGFGNQHDAYYDLAKNAQDEWESARAILKSTEGE